MDFAVYETAVGFIRLEYKGDTLTYLKRVDEPIEDFGSKNAFTELVISQINDYLAGKLQKFTIKYQLKGTEFQIKVWQALLTIPYGQTRSYKQIAQAVGNEKACRAVGLANNKNPITIIVPCHRVIGANGKLVGYGGGLPMKEYLLNLEQDSL